MANRRKFIAGLGALATGSAAAMGTGAFNIARADRGITVDTVDDAEAYLGLNAAVSNYAEEVDGQLEVGFDGRLDQNGEGLSENANYVFTDVFEIVNQGTDDIGVTLSENLDNISWDTTYPRAYYSFSEIGTTNDVNGDGDFTGATAGDGAFLSPGESLFVHFEFVGRDAELGEDERGTDTEVPETIGIYAEARDSN